MDSRHSHKPTEGLLLPVEFHLDRRELHHLLGLYTCVDKTFSEGCLSWLWEAIYTVPHSSQPIQATRIVNSCWYAGLVTMVCGALQGC